MQVELTVDHDAGKVVVDTRRAINGASERAAAAHCSCSTNAKRAVLRGRLLLLRPVLSDVMMMLMLMLLLLLLHEQKMLGQLGRHARRLTAGALDRAGGGFGRSSLVGRARGARGRAAAIQLDHVIDVQLVAARRAAAAAAAAVLQCRAARQRRLDNRLLLLLLLRQQVLVLLLLLLLLLLVALLGSERRRRRLAATATAAIGRRREEQLARFVDANHSNTATSATAATARVVVVRVDVESELFELARTRPLVVLVILVVLGLVIVVACLVHFASRRRRRRLLGLVLFALAVERCGRLAIRRSELFLLLVAMTPAPPALGERDESEQGRQGAEH